MTRTAIECRVGHALEDNVVEGDLRDDEPGDRCADRWLL
jgi:hypothetical protein